MAGIKLIPEVKTLWLDALRSGDYLQGDGYLAYIDPDENLDDDGQPVVRYCCLGVLCDLAVKAGVGVTVTGLVSEDRIRAYDGDKGGLPASVWEWATGQDVTGGLLRFGDFDVEVPHQDEPGAMYISTLAERNDDGASFDEIADLIEGQL